MDSKNKEFHSFSYSFIHPLNHYRIVTADPTPRLVVELVRAHFVSVATSCQTSVEQQCVATCSIVVNQWENTKLLLGETCIYPRAAICSRTSQSRRSQLVFWLLFSFIFASKRERFRCPRVRTRICVRTIRG